VAVVLDGQLLSVLSVDFRTYPDGINTTSADVSGGFTATTVRDLAIVVRYGPLPVQLTR
jgi:preprotein translocase subunit SecD